MPSSKSYRGGNSYKDVEIVVDHQEDGRLHITIWSGRQELRVVPGPSLWMPEFTIPPFESQTVAVMTPPFLVSGDTQ